MAQRCTPSWWWSMRESKLPVCHPEALKVPCDPLAFRGFYLGQQEGMLHLLSTYFTDVNVSDGAKFLLTGDTHSVETLNMCL